MHVHKGEQKRWRLGAKHSSRTVVEYVKSHEYDLVNECTCTWWCRVTVAYGDGQSRREVLEIVIMELIFATTRNATAMHCVHSG